MDDFYQMTLLAVDDQPFNLELIKCVLEQHGFYNLLTATSGKKGLEILDHNACDLILLDISMPEMDGFEFCKIAMSKFKQHHIPVLIVTALSSDTDDLINKSLAAGAKDIIYKPFKSVEFIARVKLALASKKYHDRLNQYRQHLEEMVVQKTKELESNHAQLIQTAKLATLGQMAAEMAHEINQPLAAISLNTAFVKDVINDKTQELLANKDIKEIKECLHDVKYSIKRISNIIKHMQVFARFDKSEHKNINVCINETIENALILFGEQFSANGIEIYLELCSEIPRIEGDPMQLEQVWINCLSNAMDALNDMKKINKKYLTIATKYNKDAKAVQIIFKDNGTGLKKEIKNKIFDPFFTTKDVGKGTGLGLSIVYGIIKTHKGNIKIKDNTPNGAEIIIQLPVLIKKQISMGENSNDINRG